MALIGGIDIALRAQTGPLKKDLKTGTKSINDFGAGIKELGGKAAIGFGVVAAGVAAGLGALAINSAKTIDETNNLAERIGVTTQAMRELQYATKLTDSEAENLGPAMLKMANNLSDAARAGGPVADTLTRIGLDAKSLLALSPDEQFVKIAGAFTKIKNPADQAAASMDIFGKTGVQLLNTLNAGPEQINKLRKEFRGLHGEIDQVDVANVAEAWDAIDRAGEAIAGVGDQIAVKLAPYITDVTDLFTEFAAEAISDGGIITVAIDGIGTAIETVAILIRNWSDVFEIVKLTIQEKLINIVEYIEMIPANLQVIAQYIAGNWKQLIIDGVTGVNKVFENLAKNLYNLSSSIVTFLSGGGFDFEWTGLLEGFQAVTEELPKLLAPELTSMQDQIDAASKRIADKEQKRADENDAVIKEKKDKRETVFAEKESKKHFGGALEMGSKEARSAILKDMTRTADPAKVQTELAKKSLTVQEQLLAETKKGNKDKGVTGSIVNNVLPA